MKNFILIILTILLTFLNNIILAQNPPPPHPPEANMSLVAFYDDPWNDFHSWAFIYSGWCRYYSSADFGYELQKYESNQWVTKINIEFYHLTQPDMSGNWQGYDGLQFLDAAAIYGNGDYRVKGYCTAENTPASDEAVSDWAYGSITDVVSPETPVSFDGSWQSNHPYISWDANSEYDLKDYVVYKKIGSGSWAYRASTTATHYSDINENPYTEGDKRFVYYKVTARDYTNNESAATSQEVFVCNPWLEKTKSADEISYTYELSQNYPNPFNPTTVIKFQLAQSTFVRLTVYNQLGQEISVLLNDNLEKGKHSVEFNAQNLPSGIYIYQLKAGNFTMVNKMILTK
ncbi:MAG: T9SS type A sorting domain-containing protein [Ignavibacteriales bacterium]|nr:T9SS type A sorting domain-containing protein [Ignavibacteriales bacterium]